MSEDLKLSHNTLPQAQEVIKTNAASKKVSFRGGKAVDSTPDRDTYQQVPPMPADIPNVPGKAACIVPAWIGLSGLSKAFDKSCGGEYEKSLMGRLGKLGDKISNSKIFNNSFFANIKTRVASLKGKAQAYIDRHPALSAFQKTPTEPENKLVRGFVEKTSTVELNEAANNLSKFVEKTPKTLKKAGATKDEIKALKRKYGTNIFGKIKNEKLAVQEFQLGKFLTPQRLATISGRETFLVQSIRNLQTQLAALPAGDPNRAYLTNRLSKAVGLLDSVNANKSKELLKGKMSTLGVNAETLANIKANPEANASLIESALEKASPHSKKLNQIFNKIKAATAPTTKLGKFLPKAAKVAMRGLTFGGGIINTALVALFMGTGIQSLVAAPKKQKVGTGVSALMDAMDWIITIPIAVATMHKFAGLKNIGRSKANVDAYKSALKAFNADVAAGKLTNKFAYSRRLVELNKLKAPEIALTKGQKFLQKLGGFLGISLEKVAPYKAATEGLTGAAKNKVVMANFKRKMPNFLKSCVGYPLRFGLYMLAFQPIVDKVFRGIASAIFGKPYDIEAEREKNEKAMEERAALYAGPRMLPFEEAKRDLDKVNVNNLDDYNLVKQKVTGKKPIANNGQNMQYPNQQFPPQMQNGNPVTYTDYSEPFMPPNWQNNSPNPQQNGQYDINKSQYDTAKRTYVPKLDLSQGVAYSDPMDDPNNPKNRKACHDLIDSSRKLAERLEKGED